MNPLAPSGCASCSEHRTQSLVQLGLSPSRWDYLVALAGNPNTGKSTVFNVLTGLRQHTGNWPGKTVVRAEGAFANGDKKVKIVDLPGTYSLQAGSADEEVARDFILFGRPDVTVAVVDATRLERNLNLVLQILEITDRVVVCLNLMDEARRHGIAIDPQKLSEQLGVPVIPTVARKKEGIPELLEAIDDVASGRLRTTPYRIEDQPPEVEQAINALLPSVEHAFPGLPNASWVALRLLNADARVVEAVRTGEVGYLRPDESYGPQDEAGFEGAPTAVVVSTRAGQDVLRKASELRWTLRPDFHDAIVERIYGAAQTIANAIPVFPDVASITV